MVSAMTAPSSVLPPERAGVASAPACTSMPELRYTAPPGVTRALASLGRTEDVCLSPSGRRLAVAALSRNRIAVFDIDIAVSRGGARIALSGGCELSSSALQQPHGLAFVDDETVIVTSRGSGVAAFTLPPGETGVPSHELRPVASWPGNGPLFDVPGSVSVTHAEDGASEILVCNNGGNSVTRHRLNGDADRVMSSGRVLLRKYLDIPDGVAVTGDGRWIAVSNHNTHNVLLYDRSRALDADSEPDGILRSVYYPHGLAFGDGGRHLFVADAGAPSLHAFAQGPDEWRGVHHPVATVRVMEEAVFLRGRSSPAHGGPKGLDIDVRSNVIVVTSEFQPLAFFDVTTLLQHSSDGNSAPGQRVLDTGYELMLLRKSTQMTTKVAAVIASYQNSTSWRITAPLRQLTSVLRRTPSPR
jgi:DNA-binding beta-propeller fold protein YncE